MKYYDLKPILKTDAHYNMIIGERSNGKTYSALEYALTKYIDTGEQCAILRRWDMDLRGKRGQAIFEALTSNGNHENVVEKLSKGKYDCIHYYSARWYLAKRDEDTGKPLPAPEPFCYGFSLNAMEHDKSTSYPNITTIIFDEFITRGSYLADEFVIFMNCLSTIIRQRNNVKIFMLGNTVNKYCPYFSEMGLTHILNQEQGKIEVYEYGQSDLRVAVEYCNPSNKKGKVSDVYFAFDNPKLKMITTGVWEIDIYPHCPTKFTNREIVYICFIEFGENLLQCELVNLDGNIFIYIHRKTTKLHLESENVLYTLDYNYKYNYKRNLLKSDDRISRLFRRLLSLDRVFYQDNEIGEIVRNYLNFCKQ